MSITKVMAMNNSSSCSTECWEMRLSFWLEGVILPTIAAAGIIGNYDSFGTIWFYTVS